MSGFNQSKAQHLDIRFIEPDTYHVEDVIKISSLAVDAWRVYQTYARIDEPREWKLEYRYLFRAGAQASSREAFNSYCPFNELWDPVLR